MHEESRWGALRSPSEVRAMFDRIAPRYDLLNRVMSWGQDVQWRKQAAALVALQPRGEAPVLDLATGTGDLALALAQAGVDRIVGVDFSLGMLRRARQKCSQQSAIYLVCGDAMRLPFPSGTFAACTIAFGLRNLPDYPAAVQEMARVLRPGGLLVVLETTPVRRGGFGHLFRWYFGRLVPFVGGLLSGNRDAYTYLPRSTAAFLDVPQLVRVMSQAGLRVEYAAQLMRGTVALIAARRISAPRC